MKNLILISTLFLISAAENTLMSQEKVLTFDQYMQVVVEQHPLAMAAGLQIDNGQAQLRKARGGFDPVLGGTLDRKDFEGKRYYDRVQGGVKIPTWAGISLDAGYTQNDGVFLNPENNTPDRGLLHAGLSIPLGSGLLMDARRADLRKAELVVEMADGERELMLNDLLLDAGEAYWSWFAAYHSMVVYQEALALAQQRMEATKGAARLGDKPFIDTLEAGIQVQNRMLALGLAQLDIQNSKAKLSVFLWTEDQIPLEVTEETIPPALDSTPLSVVTMTSIDAFDTLIVGHPMLVNSGLKIDQLEIDRRLKSEYLRPTVDLKYNALSGYLGDEVVGDFNSNDYVFGMSVKLPIFLRKARGEVQLARIKIEESGLKLTEKEQSIRMKAQMALNDQGTTADQVLLYDRTVSDYARLLEGERALLELGESSLFMINSRESSYVSARIKQIELIAKNRLAEIKTKHSLSTLIDDL